MQTIRRATRPVLESLESRQLLSALPAITVQAENFDPGGQNVGYYVPSPATTVDVETTSDVSGTYDIGQLAQGEWTQYTVKVPATGTYRLDFRVYTDTISGSFHATVDGVNRTGTMAMPSSVGWVTLSSKAFDMTAGTHAIRFYVDSTGSSASLGWLNWLKVVNIPPKAPTSLTATATGSSTAALKWIDNATNETGYQVQRMTGTTWTWQTIATLAANSTSYNDSGLIASTQYSYRVCAVQNTITSGYSNQASVTTLAGTSTGSTAPAAPSALAATATSASAISLSWTDNASNETGYSLERKTGSAGTYAVIATLAANTTSYSDSGLAASTQYYYRVRAANGTVYSAYSAEASATTQAAPVTPPSSTPAWTNTTIATQTGQFTAEFDATPQAANMDMVMGLANGSTSAFTGLAAIARFNSTGTIDARNGANYAADASVAYTAGTRYHFKLVVNVAAHTYDVYVTAGTTTTKIATGYAFRTEQATVTQLNDFSTYNTSGSALIAGLVVMTAAPVTTAPAAPTGLTATASSASAIALGWTDNATNETGYYVERSADGTTFTQIASLGAGAASYSDTGLSASTKYYYRVRAYNSAGTSAYTAVANATTQAVSVTGTANLVSPPQAAVDAAIAMPLIRFTRSVTNGAFTNDAWDGGASITLAEAAYAGNTTADARLLQQIRYSITGGNEIVANGGFASQCELWVTSMFAIAKNTPRIWSQLTAAEQAKVDLVMEASLISSAFVTSDTNPYVVAGTQQYGLDGDTNLDRDWNPNYRQGMLGGVMNGVAYFGAAKVQNILSTYNHATFLSQLQSAGLTNLYTTFNWKAANPSATAPDATTITNTVHSYKYHGMAATNVVGIYADVMQFTYSANVNAGLNGGAGINGAGMIVSGASTLPNPGALGMILEFDSSDSGGPRSSAGYSYDDYRAAMCNTFSLISAGLWDTTSPLIQDVAKRVNIGNTDIVYKIQKGYIGYSHGTSEGVFDITQTQWGFNYNLPMWDNVLKAFVNGSGSSTTTTAPAAPSALAATATSASAINLSWTDNASNETGYSLERKTGSAGTYAVIATLGANTTSYSDSGLAASTQYYYRVRAANGTVYSAYSAEASATTQAATVTAPAAPSGLTATATSSSAVSLQWADNANNETGYSVERKTGSTGTYAVIATLGANTTSYSDSGLAASTQYYYRVRAANGTVYSAYTAEVAATTQAASTSTSAVLVPGSGFSGATAQPARMGTSSQFGYNDKAIARWDTVPYQTVSGQLNVGVVAFHNAGIDRVDFSVNGGAWVSVKQMTLNPQTGVVEYWATLDPSKFSADGKVEIRAIAYPKIGIPRVLQGATYSEVGEQSLFVNVNAGGTLASKSVYVSASGGSDSTGDGSQAKPFATIGKAASALGVGVEGGTIYLMNGNYTYGGSAGTTTNRWLTITRAPGTTKSQVRLVGFSGTGLNTKLVHFLDLTFAPATANDQSILANGIAGASVWVDKSDLIGPGRTVDGSWGATLWDSVYTTDDTITASRDGLPSEIARNVTITGIGSDAFSWSKLIVNSSVTGTDSSGTTFHSDVVQFYNPGVGQTNYIIYGLTAQVGGQGGGQGIFAGVGGVVKDIAIVNVNINNQYGATNDAAVFQFCDSTTNLYIKDSTFTGRGFWRDDFSFVGTDVVVENTTFTQGLMGSYNPEPGVLIR